MDTHLPRLLTPIEVAGILGIRKSTVYQAVHDGRLPVVRLWKGRRRDLIRFRREDIETLIQSKRTSSHVRSTRG